MATKDEIKSLLEAEIGPLNAKLTSIEKSFSELEKSVKHFSAKAEQLTYWNYFILIISSCTTYDDCFLFFFSAIYVLSSFIFMVCVCLKMYV